VITVLVTLVSSGANAQIIYDNGGLATGATANAGTAAPAGTQWSEAPNPFGTTLSANTNAGFSCSVTATVFRCADEFNVPVGQTWTISQVVIFAYQTNFAGGTSPITAATLRIWNGRPGDAGATIIFGDTTTNRLASSVDSSLWRIFSTVVSPATPAATNRRLWQTSLNVSPSLVLTSGTYWIDWNTQIGATTAHFAPAVTYNGIRGIPGQSARQFTGAAWVDVVDAGQPAAPPVPHPVVPQDFPFKLIGSVSGAPAVRLSRVIDFDGDNKSDLAITRSASTAAQATWWIQNSGGSTSATNFGLGIGFLGGDRATPADFDGDGKTDIAVWRSGPPDGAAFYILQSLTSTIRTTVFGQAGDDPTIVGDYDGDGKSDEAVYRDGSGGGQSNFYYRGSLSNPGGGITFVPWGSDNDVAVPGDFDGDRKFDFHVARNSGGQMTHYEFLTTAGVRIFQFGLNTDKFYTGDFDADARTDLMVARDGGGQYDWYILKSSTNQLVIGRFGSSTDRIAPGDYDGDGRTDFAVWREPPGDFHVMNTGSSPGSFHWGAVGDFPVASFSVK